MTRRIAFSLSLLAALGWSQLAVIGAHAQTARTPSQRSASQRAAQRSTVPRSQGTRSAAQTPPAQRITTQPQGATSQPVVPGTGTKLTALGDDFESPEWRYVLNGAKASYEQDESQRPPGGRSINGRWYESAMRGQPDVVRRIDTPPGGIPGSTGSMYLATKFSGVPGELSGKQMQDDLLMGIQTRLGKAIPVGWRPSVVVRVYLPEFERWENRSGSSFGLRCDVRGRTPAGIVEPYWPGQFILFRSETSEKYDHDYAQLSVRARTNGQDVPGPVIEESGWWTFGMSFTPDGQVHQYAHAGTDDLTENDRLFSSFPYGNKTQFVDAFFVNVANLDNGKTWSTPWVIDDPAVYVIPPQGQSVASLTNRTANDGNQTAVSRLFNSLK
jgi:hypothetical protein